MSIISSKNYKGCEFSESFKMNQNIFNFIYAKSHVFNKLNDPTKTAELQIAFDVANGAPSGPKTLKK